MFRLGTCFATFHSMFLPFFYREYCLLLTANLYNMNDDVYDQKDCLNKQNETNKDQLKLKKILKLVEKVDQPNQPKTVGPNRTQPLSHKGSSTGFLFGASVLAKK